MPFPVVNNTPEKNSKKKKKKYKHCKENSNFLFPKENKL